MKAVGLYRYLPIENPDSLVDLDLEKPSVTASNDLLIRVKAISINPVDYKVRSPQSKIEKTPKILGWDVAGVVEATGPGCTLFTAGDQVYYAGSIVRPGGNSEFHLVDERIVGKKPKSISFAQAAGFPLTTITAYEGLHERLGISQDASQNKGKSILIIGGAGGVGSIAIQLAKLAGLTVIATASRPETVDWVSKMGANHAINHHEELLPQLKQLGFATVSYIFCLSQTDKNWPTLVRAIAPQGKICSIDDFTEPLNIALLKPKSATFVWESMFTRSGFQTSDMIEQHNLLNNVANLIDAGHIQSTVTETFSPINAENLRKAHAHLESGKTIGKITLENF